MKLPKLMVSIITNCKNSFDMNFCVEDRNFKEYLGIYFVLNILTIHLKELFSWFYAPQALKIC
jgi:hypothetical protein